jgi:glycosylphosphatidylinositol transamidase (GPIT) subunit GPI8
MSSSQAFLGSFESTDQVAVTITKEIVETLLSSLNMEDIEITAEQWKQIWQRIYESDLVSDFFGGVAEIAEDIVESK